MSAQVKKVLAPLKPVCRRRKIQLSFTNHFIILRNCFLHAPSI